MDLFGAPDAARVLEVNELVQVPVLRVIEVVDLAVPASGDGPPPDPRRPGFSGCEDGPPSPDDLSIRSGDERGDRRRSNRDQDDCHASSVVTHLPLAV
jgi:hypothetical protein